MKSFSFIIPHKNTPNLLKKCLSSIPHRDDVQIIVVDDNSDPEKVDFNNFPGLGDPNTEVFLTKEGRGAGYARNIGLQHANGKWIVFADADDFFLQGISDAMEEFADKDYDVVFFKNMATTIPIEGPSSRGDELNKRVDIALQTGDTTEAMLYSCPWQKFFCRELIETNHIIFNEVPCGNDVVFMGRIAAAAKRITAADITIYCITESSNSITRKVSLDSCITRFKQESENLLVLRKTKYASVNSLYYWYFVTWFNVWKISESTAIKLIPEAIYCSNGRFIREAFKTKFGR